MRNVAQTGKKENKVAVVCSMEISLPARAGIFWCLHKLTFPEPSGSEPLSLIRREKMHSVPRGHCGFN